MNYPGDTMRLWSEYRVRSSGALADPTTVTLEVKDPEGTITSYTYAAAQVTQSSSGIYYYDLAIPDDADSEGTWYYRWIATGTVAGVTEGKFKVAESEFAD